MKGRLACLAALLAFALPHLSYAGTGSLSYRLGLPDTGRKQTLRWGKDPFVPAASGEGRQAGDLKLTAVFFSSANPSAIVNDRIVYKGSTVAGQKIIDIGVTHVILQGDRGTLRLELSEIPELHDANKKD